MVLLIQVETVGLPNDRYTISTKSAQGIFYFFADWLQRA
jgi:hypothetical protein